MAKIEQQINIFMDEIYNGEYNDISPYIQEQLVCGMSDYENFHHFEDIEEDNGLFYHSVICFCILERFDFIAYFLEKDKSRFKDWLFDFRNDWEKDNELPNLIPLLDICVNYGIIFNYEEILGYCCIDGNISLLKYIIEDKKYKPKYKRNLVEKAISQKRYLVLNYFFDELKFNINSRGYMNQSYLQFTIYKGSSKKIIKFLIERGIDIEIKDNAGRKAVDYTNNSNTKNLIKTCSENLFNTKEPGDD